ncbi:hypothetical protein KDM41_18690, partial [bacterium]|nr:hypothetical protein [bacterium]
MKHITFAEFENHDAAERARALLARAPELDVHVDLIDHTQHLRQDEFGHGLTSARRGLLQASLIGLVFGGLVGVALVWPLGLLQVPWGVSLIGGAFAGAFYAGLHGALMGGNSPMPELEAEAKAIDPDHVLLAVEARDEEALRRADAL